MESIFCKKTFFVVRVVFFALVLTASIFYLPDVYLLIFAGILVTIFLRSISDTLTRYTRISAGWSLGIVVLFLALLIAVTGYFAAPSVVEQSDTLVQKIPELMGKLQTQVENYSWGRSLLDETEPEKVLGKSRAIMSGIGGAFSGVLGWFTNFLIIFFIGLYGAMEPEVYKRGFLRLIPKPRRTRVAQVLSEINETLKWWLIGKFFGMAVIGVFTTIGLWLLGIPLALILGLIAAILTFIPNIGPILALAPALLFGLTVSPEQALYVALLYIGIQAVESYVLTPLVQRKTIELPPALTLATQVFLGVSLGGLGVALATPLTVVGVVATKMLYVEDGLDDPIDGQNSKELPGDQ
jgi:predicted PurR-regulated permease PerM